MKVLVVGGCGLIGSAVAKKFSANGYYTFTVDLKSEANFQVDISNKNEFENFLDKFGRVDVFVNATYPKKNQFFNCFIDVTSIMASYMENRTVGSNGGCIILLSSIYGHIAPKLWLYKNTNVLEPNYFYCASRSMIYGLVRSLSVRHSKYGVRINSISSGGVYDNQDSLFVEKYSKITPLGRMALPEDVADAVFAISQLKYVTGQDLIVDGGFSL